MAEQMYLTREKELLAALHAMRYFVEDTVLYYQPTPDSPRRICVPDDSDLRNAIFYEPHNSATSGHPGYLKLLLALQSKFDWHRMDRSARR
ncbi:hypothetical protein PHMEG_00037559 [Phytophthora megakarya]|uniref:Integrase zinc-binding domain-containing protein n=1 Tax=Phytophthora megakarya TaxID=4795 RepID=A0A225UJP4_9STRA|nr:hypothetical protein PHMEG_00037559 [Phytophthora megakarya]